MKFLWAVIRATVTRLPCSSALPSIPPRLTSPGARFGSVAMRRESYGIESYSPYQDLDLQDTNVIDTGDLELCLGDTEKALGKIGQQTKHILQAGKRPFMLGGEHLVTLGALRAVVKKYPDVHLLHFDAHADLRDDYLGATLSHACVLRRTWELVGDGRNFSVRHPLRYARGISMGAGNMCKRNVFASTD